MWCERVPSPPQASDRVNRPQPHPWPQGKVDEAESRFREALASLHGTLGTAHPSSLGCAANLASLLHGQGRAEEAAPLLRQVLEAHRAVVGEHSPLFLCAANQLGLCLADLGQADEAEELLRTAVSGLTGARGAPGRAGLSRADGGSVEEVAASLFCSDTRPAAAGAGQHGPATELDGHAAVLNLESVLVEAGLAIDKELTSRLAAAAQRRETIPAKKLRLCLRQGRGGAGAPAAPARRGSSLAMPRGVVPAAPAEAQAGSRGPCGCEDECSSSKIGGGSGGEGGGEEQRVAKQHAASFKGQGQQQ